MVENLEFARARFFAEPRPGQRTEFVLAVSRPTASADNESCCQVKVGAQPATTVYGVDEVQALSLALAYAQHRLRLLMEKGWKFYLADSDAEPFDPCETYYPRRLSSASDS
jgi:hypothetical protein